MRAIRLARILAAIFGVVYLGADDQPAAGGRLPPAVVLLVTTDPVYSWPLLALAAPLCAPGARGGLHGVPRARDGGLERRSATFVRGLARTPGGGRSSSARRDRAVVVGAARRRALLSASSRSASFAVPVSHSVSSPSAVASACSASSRSPSARRARLRDVLRASLFLGVRRWYLTAVSLVVLVAAGRRRSPPLPAIGLGFTAAPALYLVWANSRFTLRPCSTLDEVDAAAA